MNYVKIGIMILIILALGFHAQGDSTGPVVQKNGDVFTVKGWPEGFSLLRPVEYYGTLEKEQKNGTLFEYINGGGQVYIKHGFRAVTHVVLENKKRDRITLDIYNMGTPANAATAYKNPAIVAAEGFTVFPITNKKNSEGSLEKAKLFNYSPDILVYFIKGQYLVYISLNNDTLLETATGFAKKLYQSI